MSNTNWGNRNVFFSDSLTFVLNISESPEFQFKNIYLLGTRRLKHPSDNVIMYRTKYIQMYNIKQQEGWTDQNFKNYLIPTLSPVSLVEGGFLESIRD